MKVYYSKGYAWFMIFLGICSGAIVLISIFPMLLFRLFLTIFFLGYGISMLSTPYLSIDEDRLIVHSAFNLRDRSYWFQSLKQISIKDNGMSSLKLELINDEGRNREISISKLLANSQDLQRLIQAISSNP
ncbi:MAG: hypothetical protein AAGA60_07550 [Cyanobacteria bacterium P01_E01_bin.42]